MNNVVLSGKIIGAFETHDFEGGTVLKFTLLVMNAGSKKKGSEDKNAFLDVTFWNQQAEFVKKYFQEGDYINVIGEIEVQYWVDKTSGGKRSKVTILGRQAGFPVGTHKSKDTEVEVTETPTVKVGKAKTAPKQGDPEFDPFEDN